MENKIIRCLITLILGMLGWAPGAFTQPDLRAADIPKSGELSQGGGNTLIVVVANNGSTLHGSFQITLTIKQGNNVQIKKVNYHGMTANNYGVSVPFSNISLKNANDIEVTAHVNPGRKGGERRFSNNKNTKTFSVDPLDVQQGSNSITVNVFHYGTWGYQGSGTYKAISNARVNIFAGGSAQGGGWTNSQGVWQMAGLNGGQTYRVEVSKQGFKKRSVTFKLSVLSKLIKVPLKP